MHGNQFVLNTCDVALTNLPRAPRPAQCDVNPPAVPLFTKEAVEEAFCRLVSLRSQ
jgi:hypothetical protein